MSTVKIKNSRQKIADILLSIGCVNINFKNKFTLTSGKKSPVYVDCRKLVSFPKEREIIINEMSKQIKSKYKNQIVLAGGETAGIPYSSYISQKLKLPMVYIRKKPKGFGKGKIIEGEFKKKSKSVLIEDMATDGGSKIHFINSMRKAELSVRDIFVVFFYDIYPSAKANMKRMSVYLNFLARWNDILYISLNYISMKDHANLKKYLDMISNG